MGGWGCSEGSGRAARLGGNLVGMPDCPRIGSLCAGGHEWSGASAFTSLDLIHCAPGRNGAVLAEQCGSILAGKLVTMLDQEPVSALAAIACTVFHAHEHPAPPELLAGDREFELALAQRAIYVAGFLLRHPEAAIPQHHRAAAVFPFRDRALEVAVVERMVLDLNRQSL